MFKVLPLFRAPPSRTLGFVLGLAYSLLIPSGIVAWMSGLIGNPSYMGFWGIVEVPVLLVGAVLGGLGGFVGPVVYVLFISLPVWLVVGWLFRGRSLGLAAILSTVTILNILAWLLALLVLSAALADA